jgi:hypothetical protein
LGAREVVHLKILYNISKNSLDMNHPCKSQLLHDETLRCRARNPPLRPPGVEPPQD